MECVKMQPENEDKSDVNKVDMLVHHCKNFTTL